MPHAVYIDSNSAYEHVRTAEVEVLLGGVAQVQYPDGTLQLAEDVGGEMRVYSPRLPESSLEAFCEKYIGAYRAFAEEHSEVINRCEEIPEIVHFWK